MVYRISRSQWKKDTAEVLFEAAQKNIGIKHGLKGISLNIQSLCRQVVMLRKEIKGIEKEIAHMAFDHKETKLIMSFPSVGYLTACALIGETGGIDNFTNRHQLLKLAGLNLYENSSGTYRGKIRISKRGRSGLRHILYLLARRLVRKNGIFFN